MKLPPAWEAIDFVVAQAWPDCRTPIRDAVERCYALTQKPQRELTDAEVDAIYDAMPGGPNKFCIEWGFRTFARELLCAHVRKQQEPETVKFRAARNLHSGEVTMLREGSVLCNWEWLPGEPQEYEVTLP